jgi:integrase
MTKRRSRGDGGLHWDEARQRWIASATVGYTPAGKRIVRKGSGKTKTEAKEKLKAVLRDHEDGLAIATNNFTVADAVNDWLDYGLNGRSERTIEKCRYLCQHIISGLGARKLRDLSAADVDRWLASKAKILSTSTVQRLHECLNRAVIRAMARDKVKRNVVALCGVPKGQEGRPSKSLTLERARAVLKAAENNALYAYVVISLLTGARTEELRALTWDHVDLDGQLDADPLMPPSIQVWRSVREGGDTKTKKSRRTLALPLRGVNALRRHRQLQDEARVQAGADWHPYRARVHLEGRDRAGRGERPTRIPRRREGCRAQPGGLDTARAAAQLRLTALRQRRRPGGHRRALRTRRDTGHGGRLPTPAPPGTPQRRDGHGPDLRRRPADPGRVVTQLSMSPR